MQISEFQRFKLFEKIKGFKQLYIPIWKFESSGSFLMFLGSIFAAVYNMLLLWATFAHSRILFI